MAGAATNPPVASTQSMLLSFMSVRIFCEDFKKPKQK